MKKFLLVFGLMLAMAIPAIAADSTSLFNEKVLGTKIEKASGGGGVPVGTVISWPANSNPEDPENWLECNGQGISHSVYPELFAVVGGTVPDFRGLFLRGMGGSSAGLGQIQSDAIRNITGFMYSYSYLPGFGGAMAALPGSNWGGFPDHSTQTGGMMFDASRVVPTAEENRPVNRAVRYLIRAKP